MHKVFLLQPKLQLVLQVLAYIDSKSLDRDVQIMQYFDDSQVKGNQVFHNLVEKLVVDSLDIVRRLTH
jgi:hypothetical protein